MALYMVYALAEGDADTHEWIIDMTKDEATLTEERLTSLFFRGSDEKPVLWDYGVTPLQDEGPDNFDEWMKDMEANVPAVPAGD